LTINKNSLLAEKLNQAPYSEKRGLILNEIEYFTENYWHRFVIYYGADSTVQNDKKEEDIIKLMGLYIHYCVDDKCYIKKDKIKFY
jgi:hypothetical protein